MHIEPHRYYHTYDHISYMLNYAYSKYIHSPFYTELILAILFHDIIYKVGAPAGENERKSREVLLKFAKSDNARAAADAILATISHDSPKNDLERALIDCDLAQWNNSTYEDLIKTELELFKEFQKIDFLKYKEGRLKFLNDFKKKNLVKLENIEIQENYLKVFKPKIGLMAGSYSPFHRGHASILKQAEEIFDKVIIAQGQHPDKEAPRELPELIKNRQTAKYSGYLVDYIKSLGYPVTLIRGIRNSTDLIQEQSLATFLRESMPEISIAYILCSPELQHISSTAIRNMEKIQKGSSRGYTIRDLEDWNNNI